MKSSTIFVFLLFISFSYSQNQQFHVAHDDELVKAVQGLNKQLRGIDASVKEATEEIRKSREDDSTLWETMQQFYKELNVKDSVNKRLKEVKDYDYSDLIRVDNIGWFQKGKEIMTPTDNSTIQTICNQQRVFSLSTSKDFGNIRHTNATNVTTVEQLFEMYNVDKRITLINEQLYLDNKDAFDTGLLSFGTHELEFNVGEACFVIYKSCEEQSDVTVGCVTTSVSAGMNVSANVLLIEYSILKEMRSKAGVETKFIKCDDCSSEIFNVIKPGVRRVVIETTNTTLPKALLGQAVIKKGPMKVNITGIVFYIHLSKSALVCPKTFHRDTIELYYKGSCVGNGYFYNDTTVMTVAHIPVNHRAPYGALFTGCWRGIGFDMYLKKVSMAKELAIFETSLPGVVVPQHDDSEIEGDITLFAAKSGDLQVVRGYALPLAVYPELNYRKAYKTSFITYNGWSGAPVFQGQKVVALHSFGRRGTFFMSGDESWHVPVIDPEQWPDLEEDSVEWYDGAVWNVFSSKYSYHTVRTSYHGEEISYDMWADGSVTFMVVSLLSVVYYAIVYFNTQLGIAEYYREDKQDHRLEIAAKAYQHGAGGLHKDKGSWHTVFLDTVWDLMLNWKFVGLAMIVYTVVLRGTEVQTHTDYNMMYWIFGKAFWLLEKVLFVYAECIITQRVLPLGAWLFVAAIIMHFSTGAGWKNIAKEQCIVLHGKLRSASDMVKLSQFDLTRKITESTVMTRIMMIVFTLGSVVALFTMCWKPETHSSIKSLDHSDFTQHIMTAMLTFVFAILGIHFKKNMRAQLPLVHKSTLSKKAEEAVRNIYKEMDESDPTGTGTTILVVHQNHHILKSIQIPTLTRLQAAKDLFIKLCFMDAINTCVALMEDPSLTLTKEAKLYTKAIQKAQELVSNKELAAKDGTEIVQKMMVYLREIGTPRKRVMTQLVPYDEDDYWVCEGLIMLCCIYMVYATIIPKIFPPLVVLFVSLTFGLLLAIISRNLKQWILLFPFYTTDSALDYWVRRLYDCGSYVITMEGKEKLDLTMVPMDSLAKIAKEWKQIDAQKLLAAIVCLVCIYLYLNRVQTNTIGLLSVMHYVLFMVTWIISKVLALLGLKKEASYCEARVQRYRDILVVRPIADVKLDKKTRDLISLLEEKGTGLNTPMSVVVDSPTPRVVLNDGGKDRTDLPWRLPVEAEGKTYVNIGSGPNREHFYTKSTTSRLNRPTKRERAAGRT